MLLAILTKKPRGPMGGCEASKTNTLISAAVYVRMALP